MENTFDTKAIFADAHNSFANGIRSSKSTEVNAFLASLNLTYARTGAVFNSGQFSHRKPDDYLARLLHVGLIRKSPEPQNRNKPNAFKQFARYSVMFPLRDRDGDVVNYFAIQFARDNTPGAFLNDTGLYPGFAPEETKTLLLCNDVVDAATILESGILDNREAVVALFEGQIKEQHIEALSDKALREAVLFGCPDAVASYIRERFPNLTVQTVPLPDGATLNSLWTTGGKGKLLSLLASRNTDGVTDEEPETGGLVRVNQNKLLYRGDVGEFYVLGAIGSDPATLTATVKIHYCSGQISVHQTDLFSVKDRAAIVKEAQVYGIHPGDIEGDLMLLLAYVEAERDRQTEAVASTRHRRIEPELTHARHVEVLNFLSDPGLMKNIDAKLAAAGIVGEEGTRLTVFVIAASYQHHNPLHVIVQGSSGSGKTHLLNTVAACIPQDRILNLTKLSAMSLYYINDEDITDTLMLVQDLDGLNAESLYALRELQSAKSISNFRPYRDRKSGDIRTEAKEVRGSFASLMATTHGEIFFDNFSRSVILGVSEDAAQTRAIVEYQNRKRAGIIDADAEHGAKSLLRDMHHVLKPHAVVNPYAHRLTLPVEGMMLRRLNDQFLSFTEMITLLHQYQRQKDANGRLITTKDDLRHAAELFFSAIFLKTDDLDAGLRQFFEALKRYVRESCPANKFRMRDVRHALKYSKSHVHRFFHELRQREYIRVVGGTANKGFIFEIDFFDNAEQMKENIKNDLLKQIEELD